MKFPFTWLNDFIELEKILDKEKQDVFGVAEKLTKVGVEVEEVEKLGFYDGNVVVAEVDEISPHPTKPQLLVCKINVGSDEGRIVVTSDVTVKKGQKVVYCFPGTILVKSNTLVDIMSFENINSYGMLLSLEELGIEPRSETVWKINSDWGIGSDLISNMLPRFIREEYVFTVKVPSNRADVLSVLGIARELSAIYGIPLRQLPTYKFSEDQSIKPEIVIQDGRCLRYCSRVVKKVKVRESSDIVKIRLLLSGLRPINNIVDITNYVMLAVGQPMHAFDYDKLSGRRIVVRASKEGERIVTLDGREIVLKEDTLVIADNEKPVAIAGVIGGEETRITENTTSVLFESAYFDYNTIRKTVKELGISTESSLRFSRDLGFYTTDLAINLAVGMIGEGKVSSFVDVRGSGNGALKEEVIKTSFSAIRERIGCEVPNERIKSILTFLGFELQTKGDEVIVKVPPYRKDVFIEEDIVEEVARIFGYDNVPSTIPRIEKNPEIPSNVLKLEQVVRSNLVAQGLTEVMNFSFISEKDAELFMLGKDLLVKVFNPMIAEDNTLRPMLLVNLLRTVKRNVNNGFRNLSIFEIGKVFTRVGEVFSEDKNVCIVLCGKRDECWAGDVLFSYYELRDILDRLLRFLGVAYEVRPKKYTFLHEYISGEIVVYGKSIGFIGKLHPELCSKLEMGDTLVAEFSISELEKSLRSEISVKEINRLPFSSKNISVLLPKNYYVNEFVKFLEEYDTKNKNLRVESVRVVDIYEGSSIPEGFKSVNVLIRFQWVNEVKEDTEIKVVFMNMIKDIQEGLGFSVRGVE